MIINVSKKQDSVNISYVKKDGNVGFSKINIPESYRYDYAYSNKPSEDGLISWDHKNVKRVPTRFLSPTRLQQLYLDIGNEKLKHLFENNFPQFAAADIEVYVDDEGFSEPGNPRTPITAISYSKFPYITVFGNKPLTNENIAHIENEINKHIESSHKKYIFVYRYHKNEADLLYDFLFNYVRVTPAIIGWNFWSYDWRYITNRCKMLNLDISWLSPTKEWTTHKISERNEKIEISLPMHKLIIDYMAIYKKWDRTIEVKENDTLDFVSEEALGIKKIKYPGTLQELYEKDFVKFILYSAIDSIIVELLHHKLKTMNTFLGLANLTKVEAMSAFSPIFMLESVLANVGYVNKKVFPLTEHNNTRQSFEGAFVFEPNPGLYEWVASFDYASLYPFIMRQFRISIENFLGKDKFKKPNENEIKCYTGAIFDKSYMSLIPLLLETFYNLRKEAKKVSLSAEEINANLKDIYRARFGKIYKD